MMEMKMVRKCAANLFQAGSRALLVSANFWNGFLTHFLYVCVEQSGGYWPIGSVAAAIHPWKSSDHQGCVVGQWRKWYNLLVCLVGNMTLSLQYGWIYKYIKPSNPKLLTFSVINFRFKFSLYLHFEDFRRANWCLIKRRKSTSFSDSCSTMDIPLATQSHPSLKLYRLWWWLKQGFCLGPIPL